MKLSLRTCTRVIHLSRYIDFLRIFDTIISLVFDGLEKARVLLEKFTLVVPRMTRLTLTILSCLFACLANQWSVNRYPWIIIMNVVITGANNWSMNVNMMIKAFTFLHSPTFILTDVYTLQHNKQLCVCLKGEYESLWHHGVKIVTHSKKRIFINYQSTCYCRCWQSRLLSLVFQVATRIRRQL